MGQSVSRKSDVTFKLTVNNKEVAPPTSFPFRKTLNNVISEREECKVSYSSQKENDCVINATFNNSFIGALWDAYSNHYKLILRPDDVWLTIIIALADYINHHPEEMRSCFVNHDGQKEIIVESRHPTNWENLIKSTVQEIQKETKDDVREWIEPKFTTTSENDTIISRIVLMGSLKHYFSYKYYMGCGIPEVTLKGTLQDWLLLRNKLQRIETYGKETNQLPLIWWYQILIPIIDEFINSFRGNINVNFWQSCANYVSASSGCDYLSGWSLSFCPFKDGKWNLNTPEEILSTHQYGEIGTDEMQVSSIVKVPIKIFYGGDVQDCNFYAGGIVNRYDFNTNTITPSFDYALIDKTCDVTPNSFRSSLFNDFF